MRKTLLTVCAGFLVAGALIGQPADVSFEVASIKPSAAQDQTKGVFFGPPRGGPGTSDPTQITWNGATIFAMLTTAYDVKPYQVTGPDWLRMERFDVLVKVPAGATKEQAMVMWQNLLKERFGVAIHKDSKEFQIDELVAAKGGPKLKETDLPADAPEFKPSPGTPIPLKPGPDGTPKLPSAGMIMMIQMNGPNNIVAHMIGRAQTAAQIATGLSNELNHPVVDKTGLTGKYDYQVEYKPDTGRLVLPLPPGGGAGPAPAAAAEPSDPGSSIESAIQDQLGLRLVKGRGPLEMIVVDHAERTPTDN